MLLLLNLSLPNDGSLLAVSVMKSYNNVTPPKLPSLPTEPVNPISPLEPV